jgi:hypothetical protein
VPASFDGGDNIGARTSYECTLGYGYGFAVNSDVYAAIFFSGFRAAKEWPSDFVALFGSNKGGLGIIHLLRDMLHFPIIERSSSSKSSELVARTFFLSKHVHTV